MGYLLARNELPPPGQGWGIPPPQDRTTERVLAMRQAVYLLRSRRRTFLLSKMFLFKRIYQYQISTSLLFVIDLFCQSKIYNIFLALQVGIAAVQLALGHGCTVLGTAGTQEGMDLVKSQGAHAVFNHREPGYVNKIQVIWRIFFYFALNGELIFEIIFLGERKSGCGARVGTCILSGLLQWTQLWCDTCWLYSSQHGSRGFLTHILLQTYPQCCQPFGHTGRANGEMCLNTVEG